MKDENDRGDTLLLIVAAFCGGLAFGCLMSPSATIGAAIGCVVTYLKLANDR